MSTYLITGATRGLGLALVQELLSHPTSIVSRVFATSRSSSPGAGLSALIKLHPDRITHIVLDVNSTSSIQTAASEVSSLLGPSAGLDYLINNAGVRDAGWVAQLEEMDSLRPALDTNVIGLHETIAAFVPVLRRGTTRKIVVMGTALASLTNAQKSPLHAGILFPAYKISKAGAGMVAALWANHLRAHEEGFCVVVQSPGSLKTELGGGDTADLEADVGAREVIRIMHESKPEDSGRHRNIHVKGWENGGGLGWKYDGEDLDW